MTKAERIKNVIVVTAYHEAGHAVVAHLMELPIAEIMVSVSGEGHARHSSPFRRMPPDEHLRGDRLAIARFKDRAERNIMVCFAGKVAQERFAPKSWKPEHTHSDMSTATDMLFRITGSSAELDAYSNLLLIRTRELLALRWSVVRALAKAIIEKTQAAPKKDSWRMPGKDAKAVIIAALSGPIVFQGGKKP